MCYRTALHLTGGGVESLFQVALLFRGGNELISRGNIAADGIDIEFGKRLALLRAKQKYLNAVERVLGKSSDWIAQVAVRIDKLYMTHYRKAINNGIILNDLLESLEG